MKVNQANSPRPLRYLVGTMKGLAAALTSITRPRYQDCPHCGAVIRATKSICPTCAKYLS